MMRRTIVFVFTFFILFAFSVTAISINPSAVVINFEPNYEESFLFKTDQAEGVGVSLDGPLSGYFEITEDNIAQDGTFVVTAKLPDFIETPGENLVFIQLMERNANGQMVQVAAAIRTAIVINVPYEGYYGEFRLGAQNVNAGEVVPFSISVRNRGQLDFTVSSTFEVKDKEGNLLETLEGDDLFVESKGTGTVRGAEFNTTGHSSGDYQVFAHVTYGDGKKADLNIPFRVGTLRLDILDYPKVLTPNEINEFPIVIESTWNEKINDVYADVAVSQNGNAVGSFRTPGISVDPWSTAELRGFWDARNVKDGKYSISITLHYAGLQETYDGEILVKIIEEVDEESTEKKGGINAVSIVLVVVVVLLLSFNAFLFFHRKKRK